MSTPHIQRRGTELALLAALAALLQLAADTGLAYLTGFSRMRTTLGDFRWAWLVALYGALLVSIGGYYHAYRGVFRVEHGPVFASSRLGADPRCRSCGRWENSENRLAFITRLGSRTTAGSKRADRVSPRRLPRLTAR